MIATAPSGNAAPSPAPRPSDASGALFVNGDRRRPSRSVMPRSPAPIDTPPPSKSELKRRSHDLQRLGEALSALPADRLARLDLPEPLRDAIDEFRRTRGHEARRRQMQYVGKLVRGVDDAPLRAAVAEAALGSARDSLALHEAERWRDRLLADDGAVAEWLGAHAGCDARRLTRLVDAARREAALPPDQRDPRFARELFRFIRPHLTETSR